MARQVVWSLNAQKERVTILHYWVERNDSAAYSVKLDAMFRSALNRIAEHLKLDVRPMTPQTRVKVVGDFEIFYSFTTDAVHVLSVWHSRRDPADRPIDADRGVYLGSPTIGLSTDPAPCPTSPDSVFSPSGSRVADPEAHYGFRQWSRRAQGPEAESLSEKWKMKG